MTAMVSLDTVWLNDAADPSDFMRFQGTASLTRNAVVDGRVQRVAGGGLRVIRREGAPRTWQISAPWASRAEVDWLEAHKGRTITARDHRSHKVRAVYLSVPVEENGVTDQGGVAIELSEVTHTEPE